MGKMLRKRYIQDITLRGCRPRDHSNGKDSSSEYLFTTQRGRQDAINTLVRQFPTNDRAIRYNRSIGSEEQFGFAKFPG